MIDVPTLPCDLWSVILVEGGPLTLCAHVGVSPLLVAATRIQRRVRNTVVVQRTLRAGDRVCVATRNGPWRDARVVCIDVFSGSPIFAIQIVHQGQACKQYFFLPHPSLRVRRRCNGK